LSRETSLEGACLVSVVIPARDEEAGIRPNIGAVLDFFRHRGIDGEVVAVDDGSRDDTWAQIQAARGERGDGVRAVRLMRNQGKGAAVAAGMREARGAFAFFMDADLPYDLEAIDHGMARMQRQEADLVVGDRCLRQSRSQASYPWRRGAAKRVFSLLTRILVIKGFPDTQCGFKGFRREAALDLFPRLRVQGFCFDVELLVLAVERGWRVERVPVTFLQHGRSSVHLARHSLQMFVDLVRIAYRRRAGVYGRA
jgi:dolichyl-phosphate beta-glucosyltransferase